MTRRLDAGTLLVWGCLLGLTLVAVGMVGPAAYRHAGVVLLAFVIAGLLEVREKGR